MMNIQEAVIALHDIARKVQVADGQLALDIRLCADRLNEKKTWLDGDDMDEIRRAI